MFDNLKNEQSQQSESLLNDAIGALKSEMRGEVLSSSSRAVIFDQVRRPLGVFESLAFLFPRSQAILIAVSVPLALTLALLFSLPHSLAPGRQFERIVAAKDDGNVVFTVANGNGQHRVFASTDPARFGAKEIPAVGGRFSDRAESGVELVFYRVD
jgi:hypothetical protein